MKKTTHTNGFLSPHLVAGVLVFVVMTLTWWSLSQHIVDQAPLTVADAQLSDWLHLNGSPRLTNTMLVCTTLGATGLVTGSAVVFLFYLLARRRYYWIAATVAGVFGGMLLNKLLKYVFHRPRPRFDDPILTLTGFSFPSGHTMMATVLFGTLAAYLCAQTPDRRLRALAILSAGFLVALVAFSRIYLGAHYLSDVLGAMAEGFAWLSLCFTIVYSVWRRRNGQPA